MSAAEVYAGRGAAAGRLATCLAAARFRAHDDAVRASLSYLGMAFVWLLAAWPLALLLVHLGSPVAAVELEAGVGRVAVRTGVGAACILALAALAWPTVPAGIRLGLSRLRVALTTDRGPLMRAIAELRHVETAARRLEVGRLALRLRDLPLAAENLRRAIELEPGNIAAHYQWALLCLETSQLPQARAALAAIVAADPGHAFGEAMLLLGRTALRLGDAASARDVLLRHQREHGGSRRSHVWLAEACLAAGDTAAARDALAVAAAPPTTGPRLTAEENWYRAKARVARRRQGARA
jgi:tetratricopeptide (TPR) repeat protein